MFETLKNLFRKKQDSALQVKEELSKQLITMDSEVSRSFDRAKTDISKLSSWVLYLNKHNEDIANNLNRLDNNLKSIESKGNASKELILANKASISVLRADLENTQKWISFLNNKLNSLESAVLEANTQSRISKAHSDQLVDLKAEIKRLDSELKTHRDFTKESFISIQQPAATKEISAVREELRPVTQNDTQLRDVIGLSSSEKSILRIIYSSERPLTYTSISRQTGLNYGTVKNLICRLRKKGFSVEDQVSPQGEKEFFITSQGKIALSGR